jgi:hypothetical protein
LRTQQEIQQSLKAGLGKVSRQSYWLGEILASIAGLIVGYAIGHGQVGQTVVLPLTPGIEV